MYKYWEIFQYTLKKTSIDQNAEIRVKASSGSVN